MSYSRWGSSNWHTYWAVGDSIQKQDQCFEICDFPSYRITYKELKEKGIEEVIEGVKAFYEKSHGGKIRGKIIDKLGLSNKATYVNTVFKPKNPTTAELKELGKYIKEWEKDVDEHFVESAK
jgi:hypothetical protein